MDTRKVVGFGQLLRDYRQSRKLSQEKLATAGNLGERTIRDLERGIAKPYPDTVRSLTSALHLDATESAAFEAAASGSNVVGPVQAEARARLRRLPAEVSVLIGREREVAALAALLRRPSKRLVTLVGPGGVGKTRLGIRVAEDIAHDFTDGVVFVGLGTIQDTALVASTIAGCFGLDEGGQRPMRDVLLDYLREKHLLLVLDNYEQVLPAAPLVAELLATCPDVRVVVTSREPLRVQGEQEFSVHPLAVPPAQGTVERSSLEGYAAIQLFVDRAQAVKSGFALTDDNAHAVGAICSRLDGLPLAIELAAKRVKLLPPAALLTRLDERLPLLTNGTVDVPSRHQTMRAALDWSYDLLDDLQKSLFRELAIFVGGCMVEAAEEICTHAGGRSIDVLEGLAALVDKSLVRQIEQADGTARLTLLEMNREYGRTQLAVDGTHAMVADRHAEYYARLAEDALPHLVVADQQRWLDRLEREQDNLRAALRWFEESGEIEKAIHLAGALYKFWLLRGHADEGHNILERLLARPEGVRRDEFRARALNGAGGLAYVVGAYDHAQEHLEQALAIYQDTNDVSCMATVLNNLGSNATDLGDYGRARDYFERSVAHGRTLDFSRTYGIALANLANISRHQGLYARARREMEESLSISRALDDASEICLTLSDLGVVDLELGEYQRAVDELEQGVAIAEVHDYKRLMVPSLSGLGLHAALTGDLDAAIAHCDRAVAIARLLDRSLLLREMLDVLAHVLCLRGEYNRARQVYYDALVMDRVTGVQVFTANSFEGLGVALVHRDATQAVRLWGTAAAIRTLLAVPRAPSREANYETHVAVARRSLGDACFTALWDEGVAGHDKWVTSTFDTASEFMGTAKVPELAQSDNPLPMPLIA